MRSSAITMMRRGFASPDLHQAALHYPPMAKLFAELTAVGYAQVAVERGIDRYPEGLTYGIPPELAGLGPGERVIVPLGRGNTPTSGTIVELISESEVDPDALKFIEKRDAGAARLPGQLLDLARFISRYYCAPIGMTLSAMLPAAVKKNIGAVTKTMLDLGEPLPLDEKLPAKQRAILETLAQLPPGSRPIEKSELLEMADVKTTGPLHALIERKLVEATHKTNIEASWVKQAGDAFIPDTLTSPQATIVREIGDALTQAHSTHLLFGITGSGKTEVYIRLIERVIATGKSALMLVPEIALTPQTGGRLIGRFPNHHVAVLHSGLTAAQRHQQWSLVASGAAPIILGARSAVFAPIADDRLGLIIVDEEHDGSYKQDQMPRYHGRDVAIRRAQLARCPILLGSATPSLESWHNATAIAEGADKPRYQLHHLRDRAPGMRLPKVTVVDFVEERKKRCDKRVHLIGPVLEDALARVLHSGGGQALILLNRRGYANYIACPDHTCGWVMTCDHCDVTVVYHKSSPLPGGGYVQCHHCQSEQRLPAQCPDCGKRINTFGLGTQRVEEELSLMFPMLISGDTMMRVDSDAMQNARDYHDVLERFGRGAIRVLLGTQMIAKGLDFPGVRLVGVINADTSLNLPDFRATERTFQLVSQVAGRSGRTDCAGADGLGRVIVQSFNPTAPAIQLAAQHDYEGFATLEIAERARCGLPPITRMARVVVRDEDFTRCVAEAEIVASGLKRLAEESDDALRVRGPAPCPISRIAGKHRQQIEVLAPDAAALQRLITEARNRMILKPGAQMAVDIDPIAML